MKRLNGINLIVGGFLTATLASIGGVGAQDWPQWRGAGRDAKAAAFEAPKTWPKELKQVWKVTVGEGAATPALVGNKLYVFSRQEGSEITRCLDAATGKELWQDKYESLGASGPASAFSGPRSSPVVANGKIVTLGVRGFLSCLDAATGNKIWRKDDFGGVYPRFQPASSALILDGLCIAQVGGQGNGGIVGYDLATGAAKWKWAGDGPGYASPVLLEVGGAKLIVALTETKVVLVDAADGKLVWSTPFVGQGMGGYNAATPIVDGSTVYYAGSGRGVKAIQVERAGDQFTVKDLWTNTEKHVVFNSPVLKNGLLFGLSGGNELFCLQARTGQMAWSSSINAGGAGAGSSSPGAPTGNRGRGRGGRGFGSIVDAGNVLVALTPSAELVVFEPSAKSFVEIARLKVAESETHAYPILSGRRIFIKDKDAVTLWTFE